MSDAKLRELERTWRASRSWPDWVRWAKGSARNEFLAPLELARALPRLATLQRRVEAVDRLGLECEKAREARVAHVLVQLRFYTHAQARRAGRALARCRERKVEPFWAPRRSGEWERGAIDLEGTPLFPALMDAAHWLWHRAFLAEQRRLGERHRRPMQLRCASCGRAIETGATVWSDSRSSFGAGQAWRPDPEQRVRYYCCQGHAPRPDGDQPHHG